MIDKNFGSWTVLTYCADKKPGKQYECLCKCGNIAIIPGTTLRAGRSTRCKDCMYAELYKPSDMIGKRFGKWTVKRWNDNAVNKHGTRGGHLYECVCDCGTELVIIGVDLRRGKTKGCNECGRLRNLEKATEKCTIHGMHKTSIYNTWSAMIYRCDNPNAIHYGRYGGRGITVCERWKDFVNFYEDMGDRPEGLTLDRIDNNGNYEPSNCRWITHGENCRNRYY